MTFTARSIAANCIEGYQRYISPYKGFCCAHRAAHDGASCSEWAKRAINKVGVCYAIPLIFRRFKACHAAYMALVQQSESTEEGNEKEEKDYNPCTDKQNIWCCANALPCLPFSS